MGAISCPRPASYAYSRRAVKDSTLRLYPPLFQAVLQHEVPASTDRRLHSQGRGRRGYPVSNEQCLRRHYSALKESGNLAEPIPCWITVVLATSGRASFSRFFQPEQARELVVQYYTSAGVATLSIPLED